MVRWLYHAAEVGLYEFSSTYIAIGSLARIGGLRDTSRIVLGLTLKLERFHFFSRKSFRSISGVFPTFSRNDSGKSGKQTEISGNFLRKKKQKTESFKFKGLEVRRRLKKQDKEVRNWWADMGWIDR